MSFVYKKHIKNICFNLIVKNSMFLLKYVNQISVAILVTPAQIKGGKKQNGYYDLIKIFQYRHAGLFKC